MQISVHCLNPLVAVADGAFDAALAGKIIALGKDKMKRANVVESSGGRSHHDARTNSAISLDQWTNDDLQDLTTRISSMVRLPPENSEISQLLHYVGDQKYDPHMDAFDGTVGGREHMMHGGQRLFTSICYLSEVEEGGATDFPELKLTVQPKIGRVLIFGNTRLGTAEAHPHALHAGVSVTKGEKWALTHWWRQLAYHVQRDFPKASGDVKVI